MSSCFEIRNRETQEIWLEHSIEEPINCFDKLSFSLTLITLIGTLLVVATGTAVYRNFSHEIGVAIVGIGVGTAAITSTILLIKAVSSLTFFTQKEPILFASEEDVEPPEEHEGLGKIYEGLEVWIEESSVEERRKRKEAAVIILECYKKDLHTLNLINFNLTSLPLTLRMLKSLENLDLSGNQLESTQLVLAELPSLKSLNLSRNQLKSFPLEIAKHPNLESLCLIGNQIESIPAEAFQLSSNLKIDLTENLFAHATVKKTVEKTAAGVSYDGPSLTLPKVVSEELEQFEKELHCWVNETSEQA